MASRRTGASQAPTVEGPVVGVDPDAHLPERVRDRIRALLEERRGLEIRITMIDEQVGAARAAGTGA